MKLHKIQKRLLKELPKIPGVGHLSLRNIGKLVNVDNPQQVRHHIGQLEKKGFLRLDAHSGDAIVLTEPVSGVVYLPLFSSAECGPAGFLAQENAIDEIAVSTKTMGIADPDDYFLVEARGRSMFPRIQEGDLALIKKQSESPSNSIALVLHNDIPKLKLVKTIDKQRIALCSINEEYPAEIVDVNDEDLTVLGVVKALMSRFDGSELTPKYSLGDIVSFNGEPLMIFKEPWRGDIEDEFMYEIGQCDLGKKELVTGRSFVVYQSEISLWKGKM